MILDSVNSITPKMVELALDGLALRHQAIATNIANVNTTGYKPISVSFESQVASLRDDHFNGELGISGQVPTISFGKKQDGMNASNSGIDMNTVLLNQNVVQYHALIKGIQHYHSILSIAIKEGRN